MSGRCLNNSKIFSFLYTLPSSPGIAFLQVRAPYTPYFPIGLANMQLKLLGSFSKYQGPRPNKCSEFIYFRVQPMGPLKSSKEIGTPFIFVPALTLPSMLCNSIISLLCHPVDIIPYFVRSHQ